MGFELVIDKICDDIQHECDCADSLRENGDLSLACFCDGIADGLRKALRYIEIVMDTEKAAMPASTAAEDPQKETNNDK